MDTGPGQSLNFNNTEKAFSYKTDAELKRSGWLFALMQFPWLVNLGTAITPWAIQSGLPVKKLIKNTLFRQFVGGESLQETLEVTELLASHSVDVILDYGVEGGEQNEQQADATTNEFIKVIRYASTRTNIPFISIKITGLTSFELLEKLNTSLDLPIKSMEANLAVEEKIQSLPPLEQQKWGNLQLRFESICEIARETGIGIMIDAEESWIQDPIDYLTERAMIKYNKSKPLIYNTIQLYRHDRFDYLSRLLNKAKENDFLAGVKLVRGAYMEKERSRAEKMGYTSPIQPNKEACDRDYDNAIELCFNHANNMAVIIASHNENSNMLAAQKASKIDKSYSNRIHFSQLYGMSDHLTFNLASAGFSVSKYLPFGPLHEVVPYLMRRAQENSSVSGQTSREYQLIKSEIKRRRI